MTEVHLPEAVALADYEALARTAIAEPAWSYLAGGAADEITLRQNREAYDRLRLLPRVLPDLGGAHTRRRLLGLDLEHPILLAPVAYHALFHPEGERATALGAAVAKAPLVVSTQASTRLEDIAAGTHGPLWFQLYIQPDMGFTAELVQRAEQAGYGALVVTVDAPVSLRNREQRARFRLPPGIAAVNLRGAPASAIEAGGIGISPLFGGPLKALPGWREVARLRALTRLPILLKGILAPDDALRAVQEGADGIIVSNHGGRVLDTAPATIDALPGIAAALEGRLPLLVDGGIRRGTDIVKALAHGASAVLIGRPYVHGLAVAGAVGIAHVVHLLRAELEVAMALTGAASLDAIDRRILFAP